MLLQIKNWKLALLALIMIALLTRLGFWQLSRAEQKRQMLNTFHARIDGAPLATSKLNQPGDWQYFHTTLSGRFDNQHTLLLDNKIYKGQVGYEVFTPFQAIGLKQTLLIDRGFVPITHNRDQLPLIRDINGNTTITGMLNLAPGYVKFGQLVADKKIVWPLRIEYLNLKEAEPLLQTSLYPYIVSLAPADPAAYPIEWQITVMSPERHLGYAVQWFALALTLLILSVAINRNPPQKG